MIIETVKNIFNTTKELESWYVRKPLFDAKLIEESYGRPEYVSARNGKRYLYFNYYANMDFSMMRQMGLKPHLHYSRYHFPPCLVCRVPVVTRHMSDDANAVIKGLKDIARNAKTEADDNKEEYNKYIEKYKSAFFVKTK